MLEGQYLKVGQGHQLYYWIAGAKDGIPVLFLHGGPGLGCSIQDERFFDLQRFQVLFYDQRGSGKSLPLGALEHNNSQALIEDIIKLLDHWGQEKVYLFGGSWGATLVALFAIQYPERVRGMILRGFFPATDECLAYFERGGTAAYFPLAWQRYAALAPLEAQADVTSYYRKMLQSADPEIRQRYAYEMTYYSLSVCYRVPLSQDKIETMASVPDAEQKLLVQNHFAANQFFISDGYIYEQAHRIAHIPTWIVQGRYDVLCPPIFALRFQQLLDEAQLYLVDAGHVASEPAIEEKLKEILGTINA